jgi:energy-coupling factor transport system permease protein
MSSITIGQYIPGKSWIYKLDPRHKIILTIFWIVILFLIPLNVYAMLTALAAMVVITLTTRVPFIKMIKGMKPVLFLMIFTFVLQNVYAVETETSKVLQIWHFTFGLYPLLIILALLALYLFTAKYIHFKLIYLLILVSVAFIAQNGYLLNQMHLEAIINNLSWGNYDIKIIDTALLNATAIVIRVVLMIMITSLLTFTTRYQEINQGFSAILSPLKLFHIPVGTFAMMLSLSLRFIPTLVQETDKIMKAQASRGVDFQESNLKQKINQIVSLLVPLFIVSFRKADDLANAMEARGYIMEGKRTSVDLLKLKPIDFTIGFLSILCMAGVIVARIYL